MQNCNHLLLVFFLSGSQFFGQFFRLVVQCITGQRLQLFQMFTRQRPAVRIQGAGQQDIGQPQHLHSPLLHQADKGLMFAASALQGKGAFKQGCRWMGQSVQNLITRCMYYHGLCLQPLSRTACLAITGRQHLCGDSCLTAIRSCSGQPNRTMQGQRQRHHTNEHSLHCYSPFSEAGVQYSYFSTVSMAFFNASIMMVK